LLLQRGTGTRRRSLGMPRRDRDAHRAWLQASEGPIANDRAFVVSRAFRAHGVRERTHDEPIRDRV